MLIEADILIEVEMLLVHIRYCLNVMLIPNINITKAEMTKRKDTK